MWKSLAASLQTSCIPDETSSESPDRHSTDMGTKRSARPRARRKAIAPLYKTKRGRLYVSKIEDALTTGVVQKLTGKVDLLFTSPPFPLVRKKRYGNATGEAYLRWLKDLAPELVKLVSETGSIVVEVGNSWVSGTPTMSTLSLEALLAFKKSGKLHLCQHLICHNPARLPGPAQWVNVERIRLKDSFTHVWWMSKIERPKADNRKVLVAYTKHMKRLLKSRKYNSGRRPSGHVISDKGFLKNRGGAIPPSVLSGGEANQCVVPESLLKFAGTAV